MPWSNAGSQSGALPKPTLTDFHFQAFQITKSAAMSNASEIPFLINKLLPRPSPAKEIKPTMPLRLLGISKASSTRMIMTCVGHGVLPVGRSPNSNDAVRTYYANGDISYLLVFLTCHRFSAWSHLVVPVFNPSPVLRVSLQSVIQTGEERKIFPMF